MHELDSALQRAWQRLASTILSDPDELAKRLARRRRAVLQRPPRAHCLALRACDSRLNEATAIIVNDYSGLTNSDYPRPVPQLVTLDVKLIHTLCRPIHIAWPGEDAADVARKLGCSKGTLHTRRFNNLFSTRYVPLLGGKRGRPIPILYTPRPLDPQSDKLEMPHPLWGNIWEYRCPILPPNFAQEVKRVPIYKRAPGAKWDVSPYPSRKLPPPPPDYVWYKWKNGKYIPDKHELKRQRAKQRKALRNALSARPASAGRASRPSRSHGSIRFMGYAWLCPSCQKQVRKLYMPLLRPNLEPRPLPDLAKLDADAIQGYAPTFACKSCHRINTTSLWKSSGWNELIAYLSGGLLYGHEVPRPERLKGVEGLFARKLPYTPRVNVQSPRRQQVLRRVLNGWTNERIARDMGITINTVQVHLWTLCKQERVKDRTELAKKFNSQHSQPPTRAQRIQQRRARVRELLMQNVPFKEIARELICAESTARLDARKLSLSKSTTPATSSRKR